MTYLQFEECLQCFGDADLFQLFKPLNACVDEGAQLITVIQWLLPGKDT